MKQCTDQVSKTKAGEGSYEGGKPEFLTVTVEALKHDLLCIKSLQMWSKAVVESDREGRKLSPLSGEKNQEGIGRIFQAIVGRLAILQPIQTAGRRAGRCGPDAPFGARTCPHLWLCKRSSGRELPFCLLICDMILTKKLSLRHAS